MVVDFPSARVYHVSRIENRRAAAFGRSGYARSGEMFLRIILCLLLVLCLHERGWGEIRVIPDADVPAEEHGSSEARASSPEQSDRNASPASLGAAQEKDATNDPLTAERQELLRIYEPKRKEEEELMMSKIEILDRRAAAMWMSGFLSAKPLNCPLGERAGWIEVILQAVERNDLPICKEILGLVATIISIESGFHADPPCVDPAGGQDMASAIDRAEKQFLAQMGPIMSIPPVPQLYDRYREKYLPSLLACVTEGQVETLARQISEDLKRDSTKLPDFVRKIVDRELDRLRHVVRTKGSMQLNFPRARRVMRDRGERFSDEELCSYIYSKLGGVDVGVAALKPMFVQYAAKFAQPGDLSWLFLVGMDYHYGPFSSRNMMEQIRIRDLANKKIALDGDFLHYDTQACPVTKDSETLLATVSLFPEVPKREIFKAFLLEKEPHYIYTDLHVAIADAHRDRFGETPFAVVGDVRVGENAKIKHGFTWRTKSYLKKLDRYLNSIPWDN